jgi:hypothetical protein
MLAARKPGWVLFTEALGSNPDDHGSRDYREFSDQDLGVICRLNNGYHPAGTIPYSSRYEDFARRCANFVAGSHGCKIWIIGNEMNYRIERPQDQAVAVAFSSLFSSDEGDPNRRDDADRFAALHDKPAPPTPPPAFDIIATPMAAIRETLGGEVITPDLYARCYSLCRDAIHSVEGHADDQVLIGAVAPWNNQTSYAGNENGDWVRYFQDILSILGADGCDGITLHTYTHDSDPNLIHSEAKMNPPFDNRHYEFRAYQDFMLAIPEDMRQLPVYITETDQDVAWLDRNNGWVQRAYGEIDWWNRQEGNQQIRSLILYRWPKIDKWYIEGKRGVIDDFIQALNHEYTWQEPTARPGDFQSGDVVETTTIVNMRRTPGYRDKPPGDVIAAIPNTSRLTILSPHWEGTDDLVWWNVEIELNGVPTQGWMSQYGTDGTTLLILVEQAVPEGTFKVGDQALTLDVVRMRRTPGYVDKPADDTLAFIPVDSTVTIMGGPKVADELTWWQAKGADENGQMLGGWMAEEAPDGITLLVKTDDDLEPTQPPPSFGLPGQGDGQIETGAQVRTLDIVRLRKSPGYAGKSADDVLADLPTDTHALVVQGPEQADDLTWWHIEVADGAFVGVVGWAAEVAPGEITLLEVVEDSPTPVRPAPGGGPDPDGGSQGPGQEGQFQIGELVVANGSVNVRRSPGFVGKPADDLLGAYGPNATLNIINGPREVDGLVWWHVGGITMTGVEAVGWVAEKTGDGTVLVRRPTKLPGTNIPDRSSRTYLHVPYRGTFGTAQLWGENPQIYSQFKYGGVPLKGHNGIDFLTPIGVELVAIDDGVVEQAVLNDPTGFGNYIKVRHGWGESLYAHMDSLAVQAGQSVARGELIGRSGNTGFSQGPHLHFSIRIAPYERGDGWGGFSDPLPYLDPTGFLLPGYVLPATQSEALSFSMPNSFAVNEPFTLNEETAGMAPDQPDISRP